MTNYQSFRWLWRFDSEAKWFWLKLFLLRKNLQECVEDNLYTFGVSGKMAITILPESGKWRN